MRTNRKTEIYKCTAIRLNFTNIKKVVVVWMFVPVFALDIVYNGE